MLKVDATQVIGALFILVLIYLIFHGTSRAITVSRGGWGFSKGGDSPSDTLMPTNGGKVSVVKPQGPIPAPDWMVSKKEDVKKQ